MSESGVPGIRISRATDEIIETLLHIRMFDNFDPQDLEILAGYMNMVSVAAGDVIIRERKAGNFVCFVARGEFDIIKTRESGEQVVLATLSRGASIGEMAIIDQQPRSATVRARTAGRLVLLSAPAFERVLDHYPRIGLEVLKGVARILSMNLRNATANLADHILPIA